jgi:hypothetical protein
MYGFIHAMGFGVAPQELPEPSLTLPTGPLAVGHGTAVSGVVAAYAGDEGLVVEISGDGSAGNLITFEVDATGVTVGSVADNLGTFVTIEADSVALLNACLATLTATAEGDDEAASMAVTIYRASEYPSGTVSDQKTVEIAALVSMKRGLTAWRDLTANGNDQHSTNNLTNNNATTFSANGADFERDANQSLSLADNAAMSIGLGNAFLECCWVTPESIPNGINQGVVGKSGPGQTGERLFRIRRSDPSVNYVFTFGNGTTTASIFHTTTPLVGTRVFAYWGWNPDTGKAFCGIDGTYIEATHASGVQDSALDYRVGGSNEGYLWALDGVVRSVGLWKLTQAQLNYYLTGGGLTRLRNGGTPLDYSQL